MVWGAPTSRSSGGRSAVQTMSGTPARSASTTAAWSSAAAVPLVVTTRAGPAGGQPDPEGGEPGGPLVQTDVDGMRRVRGQGDDQRRRPRARAHHGVGHAAPDPLVDQGGGEGGLEVGVAGRRRRRYAHRGPSMPPSTRSGPAARPAPSLRRRTRGRGPATGPGPRLHPDRPGLGLARRRPGRATIGWWPSTCPATAGSTPLAGSLTRRSRAGSAGAGGPGRLPRLLDGRPLLPAPGPGPTRPGRAPGAHLRDGGHRATPTNAAASAGRRGPGRRARPAGGRPVAGRTGRDVRPPMARGPALRRHRPEAAADSRSGSATPGPDWPRASGRPGPAPRSRCGTGCPT